MRRIDVQPKRCRACRALMRRKRWSDGRLEAPTIYARRQFCDNACKARGYKRGRWQKVGGCRNCGEIIRRKRYRCGDYEPRTEFNGRRFCTSECQSLYYEDSLNAAERAAERSVAIRRANAMRRSQS